MAGEAEISSSNDEEDEDNSSGGEDVDVLMLGLPDGSPDGAPTDGAPPAGAPTDGAPPAGAPPGNGVSVVASLSTTPKERRAARRLAGRRACCRIRNEGGRGRWMVAGPLPATGAVDPGKFTHVIVLAGSETLSNRELYARAVPILVKKGMFPSVAASYDSLRRIGTETTVSTDGRDEPSWRGINCDEEWGPGQARRVLDRAAAVVNNCRRRVDKGYVHFVRAEPPAAHPWHAYATGLLLKRERYVAVKTYRNSINTSSAITDDQQQRMVRAATTRVMGGVRQAVVYKEVSAADKAAGGRCKKRRGYAGFSVPDVLPAQRSFIDMKRRCFETSARGGHSMITLDAGGAVVAWRYISQSGLTGVRWYEAPGGMRKRLACHSHKQRTQQANKQQASHGHQRTSGGPGGHPCSLDAAAPGASVGGAGGHGDDAAFEGGVRVSPGPTTPSGGDGAAGMSGGSDASGGAVGGDAEGVDGHRLPLPSLGEEQVGGAATPLTAAELRILRHSHLEFADGTGVEVIVAVEFDLVSALQHAIKMRTIPNSAQVVLGGPAAMTLGVDGGPVRRRPVTAFTLTLSAPWLQSGPPRQAVGGRPHRNVRGTRASRR